VTSDLSALIARLYETNGRGVVDLELLDAVGRGLCEDDRDGSFARAWVQATTPALKMLAIDRRVALLDGQSLD
jgi:hypothetical protein